MKDSPATELWAVRHGQTSWNTIARMQGHIDIDLDELGVRQAELTADHIEKEHAKNPFTVIYSSDLARALNTAKAVASRLGLPVQQDQRLREFNLGVLQGWTRKEAKSKFADIMHQYQRDPNYVIPDGESAMQKFNRISEAVFEILERHPSQRVLLFTHGGVLNDLYFIAHGLPCGSKQTVYKPNACVCRLSYLPAEKKFIVKDWACTKHLDAFLERCDDAGTEEMSKW